MSAWRPLALPDSPGEFWSGLRELLIHLVARHRLRGATVSRLSLYLLFPWARKGHQRRRRHGPRLDTSDRQENIGINGVLPAPSTDSDFAAPIGGELGRNSPRSKVINQHERIPLFRAFVWSGQHPIKIDSNLHLTTHLRDLRPIPAAAAMEAAG